MTAGYESKEYERHVKRNFKPYSRGHRAMYETAVQAIGKTGQARIFEAGFGIGWGLNHMLEAGVVKEYVGCEPNADSFKYTNDALGMHPKVGMLIHGPFVPDIVEDLQVHYERDSGYPFDEAFCIEVIEHVPMGEHLDFLKGLRQLAPRLWFSTPDMVKVPKEGVRTAAAWVELLHEAGFRTVDVNTQNWTYLYECRA